MSVTQFCHLLSPFFVKHQIVVPEFNKVTFDAFGRISRKSIFHEIDPIYGQKLKVRFEVLTSMIKCVLYHLTVT